MKNATRNMDNKVSYYNYSSQTIITCILYCSYIGEFQSGYPGTMVLMLASFYSFPRDVVFVRVYLKGRTMAYCKLGCVRVHRGNKGGVVLRGFGIAHHTMLLCVARLA